MLPNFNTRLHIHPFFVFLPQFFLGGTQVHLNAPSINFETVFFIHLPQFHHCKSVVFI